MITMKFGGTSMGSAESIGEHVIPIIGRSREAGERPVVVVSAMSGVTNLILQCENHARCHETEQLHGTISGIRQRHKEAISRLMGNGWEAKEYVDRVCYSLERLGERATDKLAETGDEPVGWGECLGANMLSAALNSRDIPADFVDLYDIVPQGMSPETNGDFFERVQLLIRQRIMNMLENNRVPVLTGFFGQLKGGIVKTFGRGYSDLCGSLAAAATGASEYRNYTDVDGIYSADPRRIEDAGIVRKANFREVAEVAGNGGKVLHPATMTPVMGRGINVRVMNTFNQQSEGTLISENPETTEDNFKFATCKRGATRINIETPKMLGESGYLEKIGEVFRRHGVVVDLISTSEISVSVTVDRMPDDDANLLADLQKIGAVEVAVNNAIISVIGEELRHNQMTLGKILNALSRNNIHIAMISMGNGQISMNIAVRDEDADRALRVIHEVKAAMS